MFIDFPTHNFKFEVPDNVEYNDVITWLEENNVTSPNTFRSVRRFFTHWVVYNRVFNIHNGIIYIVPSRIANVSELTDIIEHDSLKEEKVLLVSILHSILKELGYYRKGKNDPVIQLIVSRIESLTDINKLSDLLHEDSIVTEIKNNSFNDVGLMKSLMFYVFIIVILSNTYSFFKEHTLDIYNLLFVRHYCDFLSGLRDGNFSAYMSIDPMLIETGDNSIIKRAIKTIKKLLKPHILSSPEITLNLHQKLTAPSTGESNV